MLKYQVFVYLHKKIQMKNLLLLAISIIFITKSGFTQSTYTEIPIQVRWFDENIQKTDEGQTFSNINKEIPRFEGIYFPYNDSIPYLFYRTASPFGNLSGQITITINNASSSATNVYTDLFSSSQKILPNFKASGYIAVENGKHILCISILPFSRNGNTISKLLSWLRNLINDINLSYLAGYYRFTEDQTVSASLRYFSFGNITFTDGTGNTVKNFNPNEFSFDIGYSRLFGKTISGAIAFRYIRSDLTGGYSNTTESNAGQAFATDIAVYYQNGVHLADKTGQMAFGLNISNIGSKLSYNQDQKKDFLPMHNSLWTNVHKRTSSHLSILRNAQRIKLLPVIFG